MWDVFHILLIGLMNNLTYLSEFTSACITTVRHIWKKQSGRAMGSYSATSWWNRWEIISQVVMQYPEIEIFLRNNPEIAPASHAKLITLFFQDKQKNVYLQLKLAAIIEWGKHFVKATYNLEGNGPLVL